MQKQTKKNDQNIQRTEQKQNKKEIQFILYSPRKRIVNKQQEKNNNNNTRLQNKKDEITTSTLTNERLIWLFKYVV